LLTAERKEYLAIEELLSELKFWLENNPGEVKNLNYITLSGSGEPTLNLRISELIAQIKEITPVPVAVITNSSTLIEPKARQDILASDLIIPSLDAASDEIFQRIDRPYPEAKIATIIEGLVNLRKEFRGKIWLEVMLVAGVNDDMRHVRKLKQVIDSINPDKVQLNSPVRTTAEPGVLSVDRAKLEKIKEIIGDKCEII
jgi:wyosine [tRNA(Phe)-imidazoG37] synthetase (radical SAM superfamily)